MVRVDRRSWYDLLPPSAACDKNIHAERDRSFASLRMTRGETLHEEQLWDLCPLEGLREGYFPRNDGEPKCGTWIVVNISTAGRRNVIVELDNMPVT